MSIVVPPLRNIVQGDTYQAHLTVYDEDNNIVNLTNYTAKMEIRDANNLNAEILYTLDSTNNSGTITIDGPAGFIDLLIPSVDTALFTWLRGYYDLKIKSPPPASVVRSLMSNLVRVVPTTTSLP